MSVNLHRPWVLIFPEDDAWRQIAVGFVESMDVRQQRQVFILDIADGWPHLRDGVTPYLDRLRRYAHGHLVLLTDLDGNGEFRAGEVLRQVPEDLKDRVFLMSADTDAETLKKELRCSPEEVGIGVAEWCRRGEGSAILEVGELRSCLPALQRAGDVLRSLLFSLGG